MQANRSWASTLKHHPPTLVSATLVSIAAMTISCSDAPPAQPTPAESSQNGTEQAGTDGEESEQTPTAAAPLAIIPAVGIGPVSLGDQYDALRAELGELEGVMGYQHLILGTYRHLGLEVILSSSYATDVSDDALVLAIGTLSTHEFDGVVSPGMERGSVLDALGEAPDQAQGHWFYPSGVAVAFRSDGTVKRVSVYDAYTRQPSPPPMQHARTTLDEDPSP